MGTGPYFCVSRIEGSRAQAIERIASSASHCHPTLGPPLEGKRNPLDEQQPGDAIKKTTSAAALGLALVLTLSACGSDDRALSSSDRDKASAAALAAVGGESVTDTDRGDSDDEYAFQVEVTFANGVAIDVQLDKNFKATKIDR